MSTFADPSIPEQIADARAAVAVAEQADEMSNGEPSAPAARTALEALEQLAEADVLTFTFGEIGRDDWHALALAHPSTDPDKRWNEHTFATAALAATAVDPVLTDAEATEICKTWGTWAVNRLLLAAIEVQETGVRIPTSPRGSAPTAG